MKSPHSADADAGPELAVAVRLLHRRSGWIYATVLSVIAWLAVAGLLGALDPAGTGAGVAVGAVLVLLLTAVAVVGIVASVADTVRLHRLGVGVRQRALPRTAHYPLRARAYSYPPRHGLTWLFGWIAMLIVLGVGVASLPGLVDGVAYFAGGETSSLFLPLSYSENCGRSGCWTTTDGILASGASVTWPDKVPLGRPFQLREPLWNWGLGGRLIDSDGDAIALIVFGVLFVGCSVLVLVHLAKLVRRWLRHRQHGRQLAGADWLPSR